MEYRQALEAPRTVQATDLLREAAGAVQQRADAAGIGIALAKHGVLQLRGDPFLLRQALINLLDNALDFAPRGSTVELGARASGHGVVFEVADRGAGVPDYARARVFERFYSLPRPDGGSRSSGLGLPFVAQVAQLHGGRAALEAREGGGSVASLTVKDA